MKETSLFFTLKKPYSEEEAKEELLLLGLKNLFTIEEKKRILIGGTIEKASLFPFKKCKAVLFVEKQDSPNWNDQYKTFTKGFYKGLAHIPILIGKKKKTILLKPGEAFGDFSHPTTLLVFALMKKYVKKKNVIDIGSGSGILSIASVFLGAQSILPVEIDKKAIALTKTNLYLNGIKNVRVRKKVPKKLLKESVVLMNMIFKEQKTVLETPIEAKFFITSGILKEEEKEYLQFTKSLGWKLLERRVKNNWLGFVFTK